MTPATALREAPERDALPETIRAATGREPKLKLCVLAACPFPANHGTPGSIRELAEATAQRGHEVHVVTYHMGQDMPLRDVHLHRVRQLTGETGIVVGPTRNRPLYDLQMVFKAIEVVRKHKLDLIHAHGYEAALAARLCRLATRRPVLYSAHNQMGDELASYNFFKFAWMANSLAWVLDRYVPQIGDRCIPHSENLQRFLHARGLTDRSEPVLNFGIEFDALPVADRSALRKQYGLGDDPVVLYSGVMDNFQRIDLLLEAMTHVVRHVPRVKLVLVVTVPDPVHQLALQDKADRLGLADRVIFTDPQDIDGSFRLVQMADVAVVPRPEAPGFPIKLLNYMAARRPCVMFRSSASGVVHGKHVWLADQDTGQSLGEGLVTLLRDASLRNLLAGQAEQFVRQRHDRRRVAEQLCDAYLRTLRPTRRWAAVAERPEVRRPTEAGPLSVQVPSENGQPTDGQLTNGQLTDGQPHPVSHDPPTPGSPTSTTRRAASR